VWVTDDATFHEFVAARGAALHRLAYLISGSWASADDLLQEALIKSYVRWDKINRNPEAYVRRVLVTCAIDERRRPHRREHPHAQIPETATTKDAAAEVDARLAARQALQALPPGQRAAVALRYWVGLDLTEVADVLGCSVGTVKSQSAKGLANLRRAVEDPVLTIEEHGS
jgi:RNA polymerase sigma-70 factor (sigma-E family)